MNAKSLNLNVQSLQSKLLLPLLGSTSNGFNGALMMCGATEAPMEQRIIREVQPKLKLQKLGQVLRPSKSLDCVLGFD